MHASQTVVYLVRHPPTHGEPGSGSGGRIHGHTDPPLSVEAFPIIKDTAETFRGMPIRRILHSGFVRTEMLARAIGGVVHVDPQFAPSLKSWDLGTTFEYRTLTEAFPDLLHYIHNPSDTPPNGEPFAACVDRVTSLLTFLWGLPGHTVCVTHNRPIWIAHAWVDKGGIGTGVASLDLDMLARPTSVPAGSIHRTGPGIPWEMIPVITSGPSTGRITSVAS